MMTLRSMADGFGPQFKSAVQECIDYVNTEVGIVEDAGVYIEYLPKRGVIQGVHGHYIHYYNKILLQIPHGVVDFSELLECIAHEYKHHIQFKTRNIIDILNESEEFPYEQRPYEIEAYAFGRDVARKWLIAN
jgi:hypothetical protein